MTDRTERPTYYDLFDEDGTFLMRAPLAVIARCLDLHHDTHKRIVAETGVSGGVCTLHMNGKRNPVGNGRFVDLQEAVGPRANY